MATIREIAKECGVSVATVSNILNGTGRASEETRKTVLAAADKYHYMPNMMARSLKKRSTRIIGIITEDLTVFNTPEIVDGINEHLDENNYSFLLGNLRLYQKYSNTFYHSSMQQEAVDEFHLMKSNRVDGVIYVGSHCRELSCFPRDYGIPIVSVYCYSNDGTRSVIYDDASAAYEAVTALIGTGADRIGIIAGDPTSIHTIEREKGSEKALYDHGILFNPEWMICADWDRQKGKSACAKLIKDGVFSFFCMNDIMAAGVYDYAFENDLKIGKDIKVIGFDNRDMSDDLNPGLSTIEIPLHEMGQKAAEIILAEIGGADNAGLDTQYKMQCRIIRRGSL